MVELIYIFDKNLNPTVEVLEKYETERQKNGIVQLMFGL